MGIGTLVTAMKLGASFGSALVGVYGTVGAALIRLAGSALLNYAAQELFGQQPSQPELKRDLRFPTSLPSYRFAYGEDRVPGTPLPYPVVGKYAYAAWLINSRPSAGPFTVYLDNREVELTGDPYDFTEGGGATATNDPFLNHVTIWIGRGDQTAPPFEFTDEAGWSEGEDDLLWKTSDAGEGCTIVFAKLDAGANASRAERWPNPVPQLDIEGKMSLIYDQREAGHDANDPDTWAWSDNHALCVQDALRQNPFRPYDDANIAFSSWQAAADASDESVALASGGSERRYRISGVLVFNGGEIEDLIMPMMRAGAANLTRIGAQLGIVPGVARNSVVTITESIGGLGFSALRSEDELITRLRVKYSSAARGGEGAELAPWNIPGALAEDRGQPKVRELDLSWCPVGTQAQRVRKIFGLKNRLQKRMQLVALPEVFEAVAGSVATVNLPEPYGSRMNDDYEVTLMHPAFDPVGLDGFAMRCPVQLTQYSDAVYAWDETVDEVAITDPPYDGTRDRVPPPGALSADASESVWLDADGVIVPRIRFEAAPSTSSEPIGYEWQYRENDAANGADENWISGGTIAPETLDAGGDLYGYLTGVSTTPLWDIRMRTVSSSGASLWVSIEGISFGFVASAIAMTGGAGQVNVTGTTPASNVMGVRVWRAAVGAGFGAAVDVSGVVEITPGGGFDIDVGDAALANLVTNGTFDDGTGWTAGGGWSIASGEAAHTPGAASDLSQAVALTEATDYRATITVSGRTAGGVTPALDGATTESGTTRSADGTFVEAITAPASPTDIVMTADSAFDGAVDDIWLVEDTAEALPAGEADFYVTLVTLTGSDSAETGPFTTRIY